MRLHAVPERRPRVCIVRHNYYPDTHVRRDAEALVDAGYDVTVIALRRQGQAARESLNGVDIHRLPVEHRRGNVARYLREYLSFAVLAFLRLTRLHLRRRFCAVEVDNMPDILVFCALIPKLTGTPIIFYIFDAMPDLLAYLWKTNHRHPVVRLLTILERISTAFANRVVVTQEMPRRALVARGIPAEKITVVVNSADEAIFHRDGITAGTSPNSAFQIVTHGAILERYGGATLIDALPAVLKAVPDTQVQIFGAGEFRDALEERVKSLGVQEHVHFRGFAPQEELLQALVDADAGYVGMLNDLVLPNKLMEYVAMDVPVVLSRWPTFLHYFPEHTATYFRAGDAADLARVLIATASDPAAARARAQAARQRYQHYRWPVQRQVYLSIYNTLLAPHSRPTEVVAPSVDRSEIA